MWRDTPANVIGRGAARSRDAGISEAQGLEQQPTGRIGQGRVRAVEHLIFNHLVDYSRSQWVCWHDVVQQ